MSDQRGFISAHRLHPDPYAQSRTAERTLNAAIVHADITRSYEEYLEIFDRVLCRRYRGKGAWKVAVGARFEETEEIPNTVDLLKQIARNFRGRRTGPVPVRGSSLRAFSS